MSVAEDAAMLHALRQGAAIRVRLIDGRVIEGRLLRADRRLVRVRTAGHGALMVVYRAAVTRIESIDRDSPCHLPPTLPGALSGCLTTGV